MKKISGSTLLFVLLVVLGLYTYFFEFYKKEKDDQRKTEESKIFLSLVKDQVHQITIRSGNDNLTIERTVDGWQLTSPIKDIADNDTVESFVNSLIDEKTKDLVKEGNGSDDKTFGFGEKSSFISLKSTAGVLEEIEISQQKNFEGNIFLRRKNENKIYVAASAWLSYVGKKSADFRDKRFLRARIAEASKVEIENQNGQTKLELKDGKWTSPGIGTDLLDQNRIREVLSAISDLKVQEILSADIKEKSKHNFQSASVKIKIEIKVNSEPKTWIAELSTTKDKASIVATNSFPGYVVKFDKSFYDRINEVSVQSLRDHRKPFDFDKTKVRKILINSSLKKAKFIMNGADWVLDPVDANTDVQQNNIKDLVDRLRTFEVTHFISKSDWKNFKSENQIQFEDQDGKSVFQFMWGQLQKKKFNSIEKNIRYAKTSLSEEVFVIEESNFGRLNLHELSKQKSDSSDKAKEVH